MHRRHEARQINAWWMCFLSVTGAISRVWQTKFVSTTEEMRYLVTPSPLSPSHKHTHIHTYTQRETHTHAQYRYRYTFISCYHSLLNKAGVESVIVVTIEGALLYRRLGLAFLGLRYFVHQFPTSARLF